MKRILISLGMAGFVLYFCLPAMAEVLVTGTVDKTKTVKVREDVCIDKTIDITATLNENLDNAAEADAVVNQDNFLNYGCENCAEKLNLISNGAYVDGAGMANVNQAVGNMSNQANMVSLSVDFIVDGEDGDKSGISITQSQAAIGQDNEENEVCMENILFRDDEISGGAFSGTEGVINVNQGAGNINNQANTESIALGFDVGIALAEADLGQFNACNFVTEGGELGVYKSDWITGGAFSETIGIIGANQASGNMNNQTNSLSMSASVSGL